jgi:DNA-binding beta-propeller fold protein YncE
MSKIIFCVIALALFASSSFELSAQELTISDENMMANASYESLEAIANITLGKQPYCIAVNDETNRVYVGVDGGLMVINGETDEVIAEIPLSDDVIALAVNPQTNRIYAGVYGEKNVTVINGATNLIVGTIPEHLYGSRNLAANPITNRVYIGYEAVLMGYYDRVIVYDGENLQFVISVQLGLSSYYEEVGVAVNPNTNIVYATWTGNSSLYMIDGNTHAITNNVRPSSFTYAVMVNSYTNYVYIGDEVLNGETLEQVTSDYTGKIKAIDPIHNLLYTTESRDLYRLNGTTHTVIDSLELHWWISSYSDPVAVNPKTSKIYIVNSQENQTCVVSAGALPQPTPSPSPSPSPTSFPTASPTPTATPTPTSTPTPSPSPTATPTPPPTPTPNPSPTASPTPTPTPSPSPSAPELSLPREVIYAVVAAIIIVIVAVAAVVLKKRQNRISKAPIPPPPPF